MARTVTSIHDILARLDNVRQTANGYETRCPNHDDNHNSLCIGVGDDGRTLIHCQAGCATEDVLQQVGLSMADLMPPDNLNNGRPATIATYDYTDEQGELLFQVVRRSDKSFLQRRPDGNGDWIWKLGDTRRVLYRLPQLLESQDTVFVVEGEKDVDRLISLGFVATCNAGGAGKWKDQYGDCLLNRHAVVLPDNDDAGRKHAEQVAKSLVGKAASVKVLNLPGLPEKGDVSDWLNAGNDESQLRELACACPQWQPSAEPANPNDPRIEIVYSRLTSAELDAGDFSVEYLIDNILVADQPAIVSGAYKSMKTSVSIDLGISLSIGGHFLGYFNVNRACRVKIMSGEAGRSTTQETARRIARAAGYNLSDLANLLWSYDLPKFGDIRHEDALRKDLTDDEIEVLICDPAYLCMPSRDAGNLFAQGELLRSMNAVCQDVGVTFILDHHTSRGATRTRNHEPPELDDIAWAGFAEWARQWLLLGRREAYEPGTGDHALWLNVGGSAGHSGLFAVNISESVHPNRHWDVEVMSARQERQERDRKKEHDRCERERLRDEEYKRRLLVAMQRFPNGETTKALREASGLRTNEASTAIRLAVTEGRVEPCAVVKSNGHTYEGWKLKRPGRPGHDRDTTGTSQ